MQLYTENLRIQADPTAETAPTPCMRRDSLYDGRDHRDVAYEAHCNFERQMRNSVFRLSSSGHTEILTFWATWVLANAGRANNSPLG